MRKGQLTKEAVLDRSVSLASQLGLDGLSIGLLADDLGMSKSGLFAHFGSKENLQLETVKAACHQFVDEVVAPAFRQPRGEARLRAVFENWLVWEKQRQRPGGCPIVAISVELDDKPGPARDYLVGSQKDWLGALSQTVQIAIDEGQFRPDIDTSQVAYELYSLILGYHHVARLLQSRNAEAWLRTSFESLLDEMRIPENAKSPESPDDGDGQTA